MRWIFIARGDLKIRFVICCTISLMFNIKIEGLKAMLYGINYDDFLQIRIFILFASHSRQQFNKILTLIIRNELTPHQYALIFNSQMDSV